MSVDFDLFHDWCKDRFGEANVRIKHTAHGTEITTHSLWSERKIGKTDNKFHLWMNPAGGKNGIDGGAYRCWLTDTMGSLVSLVSEVDNIPLEDAEEAITGSSSLRALERKVHEFFGFKEEVAEPEPPPPTEDLELPDFTFLIEQMSPSNHWRVRARRYLGDRKIPTAGLYVCTCDQNYGNRIVIPWYDRDGKMFFWNARTMSKNEKVLRYLKPEHGDQEKALFMTVWPDLGTKVYIMEGEFDAISLSLADLVGCACGGKYLSETQIEMLRGYIPVLAFDADGPGKEAMINVGAALLEAGFPEIYYVRPPEVYKDWNKLLQQRNIYTLRAYVERFEKRFTDTTPDFLRYRTL